MESSKTSSFKDDKNSAAAHATQAYPPPPYYGGGYPGYALPPPMAYGGYPSPPPPYGAYPQAYGYPPHPSAAAYGYAPPANRGTPKKNKKSGFGKILGLGAGLVGGLLLGDLGADGGVAALPSSGSFYIDPTGGGNNYTFPNAIG